jgi:hypothetical protein
MSENTEIAYLAEYRDARRKGDYERAIDIVFDAIDRDERHLLDEIRGLHTKAAA